jgi:rhodanese-related sulfurtransferase
MVMHVSVSHLHGFGAAVLLLASAGLAWYGQPTPTQKWRFMSGELEPRLTRRQVQIEPAELAELMHNDYTDLQIIDVRNERDWNLFHLWGAERIPKEDLVSQHQRFAELAENGVIVFVSNDEASATEAWKLIMATASKPNAYILAGGINRWLTEFAPGHHRIQHTAGERPDETLRYPVKKALGSRHPAALPDPHHMKELNFARKVKMQRRVTIKGGCG